MISYDLRFPYFTSCWRDSRRAEVAPFQRVVLIPNLPPLSERVTVCDAIAGIVTVSDERRSGSIVRTYGAEGGREGTIGSAVTVGGVTLQLRSPRQRVARGGPVRNSTSRNASWHLSQAA